MPNIKFRASCRTLTSHAGLSIIGQCFEIAGVDSIDSRFPTTLGMRTSDVIKSYLGLLCLGMSDYDAVENFRRDKPFQQLLTLQKVPSAATLRQRLEKLAANDLQARTATWSTTLLSLIEAPITAETTHVCLDIDTFVMQLEEGRRLADLPEGRWLHPDRRLPGQRRVVPGSGTAAWQAAHHEGEQRLPGAGTASRPMPDQATDPVTRGQRLRQPGAPGASRTATPGLCRRGAPARCTARS